MGNKFRYQRRSIEKAVYKSFAISMLHQCFGNESVNILDSYMEIVTNKSKFLMALFLDECDKAKPATTKPEKDLLDVLPVNMRCTGRLN